MLYIRVITLFQKATTYKWIFDFKKFSNAWIFGYDIVEISSACMPVQSDISGENPQLAQNLVLVWGFSFTGGNQ